MSLFAPPPPPQQRRLSLPPSVATAASGAGAAAGTATAQAIAPFGVGFAAGTSSVSAVGAPRASGAGASTGTSTAAATSATGSPFPLTVSSDGRFFKQNDGKPFLICAQSTWSLGVNIPLADIDSFLTSITGQGFNTVMMNAIEHHFTIVKPPKERGGLLPFTKQLGASTFTGSPNGTTSANGTQGQFTADPYSNINNQAADWTFPNESYWQAIETILNACLAHGVLVFVWPSYLGFHAQDEGWLNEMVVLDAVTGAGGFTGFSFANPAKSKLWNYAAWLADRWKSYPNIIWMMGGDYGSGSQSLSTPQRNAVNNVLEGLKSVPGQASLLYSAHWERPCISTDTNLTAGSWDLNFAYCDEAVAEVTRRAYSGTPAIPAILGEYNYEDGLFGGSAPWRKYVYWGFLGGVAGGFFGHEQLWRFDPNYTDFVATQATLDASRQFAFWKSRPWHRLKPSGLGGMGTIITAGGGTASPQSTNFVAAAATSEGDLLLAYIPPAHTGSVTVDMTKMSATAAVRWFDPTNSSFTSAGARNNTGTQAFTPPSTNSAGDTDFLLVLETSAGSAAGTATATASGISTATAAGASSGLGAATGVGASFAAAAGAASGASTAAASSTNVRQGAGASAGTSSAGGVGAASAQSAGSVAGTGIATAAATAIGSGAGAASGVATGSAIAIATVAGVAAASGISAALATGTANVAAAGSSAGTGTAVGVGGGLSGGATTGTAIASSSVSAVGAAIGTYTGSSTGAASAIGVGIALARAVAVAAGTSAAAAFSGSETPAPTALSGFEALVADMDALIIDIMG